MPAWAGSVLPSTVSGMVSPSLSRCRYAVVVPVDVQRAGGDGRRLHHVGNSVVVAVAVLEVGRAVVVGVERRGRIGAGLRRVADPVAVAVDVAIGGDAVGVDVDDAFDG